MTTLLTTLDDAFAYWQLTREQDYHPRPLVFLGRPHNFRLGYVRATQRQGESLDDFLLRVTSVGTRLQRVNEVG